MSGESQEGLLGQVAGDEVEGLFVPGLAGSQYRQKAVEAARSLVRVVRYTDSPGAALEVGIGIASGEEFVGNVAGGGYKDFAAVGDVTNTAARLTSVARNSEIVIDANRVPTCTAKLARTRAATAASSGAEAELNEAPRCRPGRAQRAARPAA